MPCSHSADLTLIVAALGGDLYAGGRRANVPAPGHSPADRSVSLWLDRGRVVVHSFGAATWQAVRTDLQVRGLVDGEGRLVGGTAEAAVSAAPPSVGERRRVATALWAESTPLRAGAPAGRYCQSRGLAGDLSRFVSLRSHPAVPLAVYRRGSRAGPALLAAVHDPEDRLCAVEITYLDPAGRRRARMAVSRKTVGVLPPGAAVRLAACAEHLLVGEGVFTTLAAMERFGSPGWALLSAGNLSRWRPPARVRSVIVAADRDATGRAAAGMLARSLRGSGVQAMVRTPPWPFGDWDDARAGEANGRSQAGARRDGQGSAPGSGKTPDPRAKARGLRA